jgi:hypothetical protein
MLRYFIRPFTGYQICIGENAHQEGDPYDWCIPIKYTGEFSGYSTKSLTTEVVNTAIQAAESLSLRPHRRRRPDERPLYYSGARKHRRLTTMALPDDVNAAVDQIIASAWASVNPAVEAVNAGATRMLAAAAALQGQPADHPALDEVLNKLTAADQEMGTKLDTAVASFQAASLTLGNALPAAPAEPTPAS